MSGRDVARDRGLRALFDPGSVAVVGASDDPRKWGHWIAQRALRGAHRRSVYLVNRRAPTVLAQRAYRAIGEVPERVDLAVVAVPAGGFENVVDDALEAGAAAIIGISAGLGELGGAARERQDALVARVRAAGAVLLGPNCLGLFDAAAELDLTSNDLPVGRVGFLSQSGNLALEVGRRAATAGIGFGRFVSLGNQADLDAATLLASFGSADLDAVAVYCEDFKDGRAFAAAAAEVAASKPVVVLAAGESDAGARAATSHTGALTSGATAVEAALAAAGAEAVRSPRELVDLLQGLRGRVSVRGRRVAILADGGGHGVVAADLATRAGLEVPLLSAALAARVASALPDTATATNPVDLAGGGEQDPWSFVHAARALLASGEVDALLLTGYFGGYAEYAPTLGAAELAVADALAALPAESGRPLVVQTMYPDAPAAKALRRDGVAVYDAIEDAVHVTRRLADRAQRPPAEVVAIPEPAAPVTVTGYLAARELLAGAGIRVPAAREASSAAQSWEAAQTVGLPAVMKTLALSHKSDAGGVALGLASEQAVRDAYAAMTPLGPSVVVEEQVGCDDGVELLAGVRWDARFGPVLVVGLGGIYAEVLRDAAAALAPVDEDGAWALLLRLRGAALLTGARGRRPVHRWGVADAVARLSLLGACHPELEVLEVNPLLAGSGGAVALDARMVPRLRTQPGG